MTGAFDTVPGLLLLPYLTDTLGVTAGLALLVLLPKAWDVLVNSVAGRICDAYTSALGPRRPFLLAGGLAVAVLFALIFAGPVHLGAGAAAYVTVLLLATATGYALLQVPYVAMPAEMTDGHEERTRLMTGGSQCSRWPSWCRAASRRSVLLHREADLRRPQYFAWGRLARVPDGEPGHRLHPLRRSDRGGLRNPAAPRRRRLPGTRNVHAGRRVRARHCGVHRGRAGSGDRAAVDGGRLLVNGWRRWTCSCSATSWPRGAGTCRPSSRTATSRRASTCL